MKKHLSLLMLMAALIVPWASNAQEIITIGTGTSTSYYIPFNSLYGYSFTEEVYPASAINIQGSITKVKFYLGTSNTAAQTDSITLYMKNVSRSSFSATTDYEPVTASDIVYSGSWTIPANYTGWVEIELDDPFAYDGVSNLMVAMHEFTSGYSSRYFCYTSATNSGVSFYSDSSNPDPYNLGSYGGSKTLRSYLANMQLEIIQGTLSCYAVKNLTLSDITSESMLLSWFDTTNTAATYTVYAVSDTDTVVMQSGITDTFYSVSNLENNTSYTYGVVADCGAGDESSMRYVSGRTLCVPVAIDSLPWIYGVEDASATGSSGTFNSCMGRYTNYSTAYPYPSSSQKHSGNYALYFYSTSAYHSYVTLPMMEEDLENLYLTFWAYKTSANYGHVYVGVMSNPGDISTFDTIATLQVSAVSAWEFFEVPLSSYTGNGGVIALLSPNMSAASYVYIDDIVVGYPPACTTPANVAGSNATANSVDVSWVSNAAEFVVEYGLSGFVQGTGDSLVVSTNTVTLDSLRMGMIYDVHVTAICGDDTSNTARGTVTTGCAAITADDLPYTEDFETYGSGSAYPINACWHKGVVTITGSGTTTNYPYPTSTAINGSRSLYFYAATTTSTSYYNWMVLPPIDESLNMSDLMVTFKMKRTTTSTHLTTLVVGVTSDYTSTAGFVPVDTIDLTSAASGSIHDIEVSFANYSDTGRYVLFYAPAPATSTKYNAFYVDDIALREIPSCYWPADVVLDSVLSDEAYITWTPDPRTSSPNAWNVEYGPHGFTPGSGITEVANDTTIILTNLTQNTQYDIYISADCGGDVSDPAVFTFRTLCSAVPADSLPYVEDFESYSSGSANPISPCWYRKAFGTTTAYPYPSTSAASSGSMGLYSYCYGSIYEYAALPLFVEPVGNLMLDFDLKRGTSSGTTYHTMVYVGVMTNADDLSTFDTVAFFDDSQNPTSSITHHVVSFEGYTGSGRIAFLWPLPATSSHYNYAHIDNVVVDRLPDCRWPIDFVVDSVGAYEVDLSWSGSASSYEVQSSTNANFTSAATTSTVVYDTVAYITSLNANTQYYFRVRSLCNGDSSQWSAVIPLRTRIDCGPNSINILDTIGVGTSSGYTYMAYNYNSYPYGYTASIFTASELGAMGLLAGANINSISVHAGATACTINGFKIYMAETNFDEFAAASDTALISALTLTQVYNGTLTTTANTWVEIPLTTPFAYSGTSNLLIIFERTAAPSASGNFYYGSTSPGYHTIYGYRSSATANRTATRAAYRVNVAFNICAEVPSCVRPTNVSLDDLNDNSATLSWVSNAGNFEYTIGPSGFDPDSSTAVITPLTADSVVITGLTSNTEYDFYVRTVCGNDASEWSIVTTFRTACSPMQLPYFEDFESYGSGATNPISLCWNKGTSSTTAYPYPYATNAISGQRSLYFYGYYPSSATTTPVYSYAALPMMAAPVDTLAVAFSMRRYATTTTYYTSRLVVGVMVNPEDISTFTPVDTFDLRNEDALSVHRFEVFFNNYTGNGQYIAFYDEVPPLYGNTYSYSYVYLDDIEVDYIPTCSRPTNVTINNIGQTTATVHWTSSATNFEVEYGEHGFVQGTGTTLTASVDSVDITGLTAGVNYDVYVRALCSATDMSPWSFAASFYTECGIFALPYTEDFESYNSGASIGISPCWVKGTNYTTQYPYPYSTNAVTGQRSLYFYAYQPSSGTAYYSYAALPEFNAPVNTLELSFNMRRYSSTGNTYTSLIVVGVMTDPTNINTFSAIDTIDLQTATASSIHEVNVTFDSYTDTGKYITLYAPVPPLYGTGTYCYNYTYIDDIVVAPISPCPRAFDLTAYNGTTTSVTLEWTDTIGSSQWVVEYGELGDTATSTVTVNANPYVLTGLTPNTNYRYRVAPICSNSQQADWSRTWHKFSTALNPATLPYSYDFEAAGEWANWQTNSNNTINWYRGTAATGNNTNAVYLSTDNGATHSWNMNILTNAVVYRDIDFGPDTHSYQIDFDAYIGGTIGHNYDGISVVVADPAVFVEGSNTGITSPWGHVNTVGLGTVRHDTVWGHHTVYVDGIAGVKRVAFYHFNQATGSGNPYEDNPSAIDNISIVQQACERPANLVATNATINSVQLSWFGEPTAQYQVAYRPQSATAADNQYTMVNGTSTTIYGLSSSTNYYWWVRKICTLTATDTLVSGFSVNGSFTTLCAVVSVADTLFEDFENYAGEVYNAEGVLPNCWEGYNATNTLTAHVTNGGTYSYCVSGTQAVTLTSGTNASYTGGTDNYMRLVDIAEPTNTLTMTFWMCTESSTSGFLEIGYLTGSNYETDFVALKHIAASSATMHSGNGLQPAGHGIFDTVTFDSVPMGNFPICFRWNYTTSYYSCCIDDVKVWSSNACVTPTVTLSNLDYESVNLTATGNGSLFELEYGTDPAVYGTTMTSTTGMFNITGLTPATQYFYRVRQQCDSTLYSLYNEGFFVTDSLPCVAVSDLTLVGTTFNSVSVSWTANGEETAWEVHVFSTIDDTTVTVTTTAATVGGLVSERLYNISVRPMCGSNHNIEGPWSDTIQAPTDQCQPVTNVTVSNIGTTTATISWTAPENASNFRVIYGLPNFDQGGELASYDTESNPFELTNLEPNSDYTVRVANVCAENLVSQWASADFSTTGVGINGVEFDGSLSLYPNPASTMVTLSVSEQMVGSTVSIVDVNGRVVYTQAIKQSDNQTITIDLSDMAKGAYFVRITGEETTVVRKLIVE